MEFIATLEHSPDNCWAREDMQATAEAWTDGMVDRAAEHEVELLGAYATPNEHRFYYIMEADSFEAVTGFLGPPVLEDHEGHIAPVLPMTEAVDTVLNR